MNTNSTKDYLDSVGAVYRKAETAMFYEIADSLSRNGIMVLRYDKRSYTVNCIENPACWYVDTISPYDYIKDIHNAVDFVKGIPAVDTCNIFLAGHSQGGSFVRKKGWEIYGYCLGFVMFLITLGWNFLREGLTKTIR